MPVAGPAELPPDRLHATPDIEVTDHPVFRIFAAQRNSFLATVTVSRYFALPDDWQADKATEVIARLRNGAPLVIQRRFGEGRVVAFLTTAAPTWNNWARGNPSFVVTMLELQAYLADNPRRDAEHLVGSPLKLTLEPSGYDATVRFETPGAPAAPAVTVNAATTADGLLAASFVATDTSGIYRAMLAPKAGGPAVRHWAVNVDPAEGDLATIDGPGLAARLEGVDYRYQQAAVYESPTDGPGGQNLAQPLLYALVLLLIGEQLLAWRTSYHPRKMK